MTRLMFIKLLRDMRMTWPRVVMMVAAIGISMIVFSSMLYARSLVRSNTVSGYASTNPASARITIEPGVSPDDMETFIMAARAEAGVTDAAMRSVLNLRIQEEDGSDTTPLQLFVAAPDDPMRIANFEIEQGSWPAPGGSMLLERTSLEALGLKTGDRVTVIGPDGKTAGLTISGVVHDQALSPAIEGGTGYITTDTLPLPGAPPVLDQLAFMVSDAGQGEPSDDRDAIVRTSLAVADRLKQMPGVSVEQSAVPPPYEHPHQGIANTLLTSLLAFGGLALLLSAILIATLFNGLLTQQIPQIGMMKAIGAGSSRIMQLYLTMILIVAVLATVLALPPGILLGRGLARMLLGEALNMDIASLRIPVGIYAVVFAAGIGLPVLIALFPLVRAGRRTVRQALNDRGLVDDQAGIAGRLLTWLGRFSGINRVLLMALRNIFRRRARFLLSAGLLATAGSIFISGLNVMDGFKAIPETIKDEQNWDVQVKLAAAAESSKLNNILDRIPGVTDVESWNIVTAGIQYSGQTNVTRTYPDQGHGSLSLSAIPASTSVFNPPEILDGRWLEPNETGAIVLSQNALKTVPDVKPGESIELWAADRLTTWKVVGIASELAGASCPCVTQAGFEQAMGIRNQANVVRIVTDRHDETTRIAAGQAASEALSAAGIRVNNVIAFDALVRNTEGHSELLVVLILLMASAIGLVGLIGLGSTMSTNVVERTREFGVLSAIGANAATVRRLVVFEGVFVALASCIAAALPAIVLTVAMGAGLGELFFGAPIPFQVSASAILIWLAIIIAGATLATLAPAYRASRLTVREALAYL